MSTKPPEPSPAQIAQWWAEARDVHPDNPGLAPAQLARIAYAAGWEARAAVKESLTAEAAPADSIRTALKRLLQRLDETTDPGDPAIPAWIDSYAAARAALAAAPSDEPAMPEGREPVVRDQLGHKITVLADLLRGASLYDGAGFCGCTWEDLVRLLITAPRPRAVLAAALLQQQVAELERLRMKPVAVSERLPEAEDCDAEGRCWWGAPSLSGIPHGWRLCQPEDRFGSELFWRPFNALPLPSGEVANG